MKLPRRRLLAGATAGIATPAILRWPANAAEFTYKCGGSLPDGHPMAIRAGGRGISNSWSLLRGRRFLEPPLSSSASVIC